MITGLLESKRRRERRRGGTIVSAVAHTVVIALAVAATGRASVSTAADAPELLVWVDRAPAPEAPRAPAASGAQPSSARPATPAVVPELPVVPNLADIVAGIPPVDLSRGIADDAALRTRGLGLASPRSGAFTSGAAGNSGEAFPANLVERPVVALAGNRAPRYPEMLRSAGVSGRVVARFIVDTAGRVEPSSVRVLDASHPQFATAVLETLPKMRFLAAEASGRKVRQLVELPFEFEVR